MKFITKAIESFGGRIDSQLVSNKFWILWGKIDSQFITMGYWIIWEQNWLPAPYQSKFWITWGKIDSHFKSNNIWTSECKIGSKFIMCDSTYWFTIRPPGVRRLSLQNVFNTHGFSLCKSIYATGISLQNINVKWNPRGGDGKPISWTTQYNERGRWEEIIHSMGNVSKLFTMVQNKRNMRGNHSIIG